MKSGVGTGIRGNARILVCLRTGESRSILPCTEHPVTSRAAPLANLRAPLVQDAMNEVLPIDGRGIERVDSAAMTASRG